VTQSVQSVQVTSTVSTYIQVCTVSDINNSYTGDVSRVCTTGLQVGRVFPEFVEFVILLGGLFLSSEILNLKILQNINFVSLVHG
jgi:hypothetical protein